VTLAVTLAVTIVISVVVSLTLTPMMTARIVRHKPNEQQGRFFRASERVFESMIAFYGRTLQIVEVFDPERSQAALLPVSREGASLDKIADIKKSMKLWNKSSSARRDALRAVGRAHALEET
jgi:hypothetical protein